MAATALTTECRAVAERMTYVSELSGNLQAQHKMAHDDPASLRALSEACSDATLKAKVEAAAVALEGLIPAEGNLGLHGKLVAAAIDVLAACDAVEGTPPPIALPPANVDQPHLTQAVDTLNCTMGNWDNMQDEPHSYSFRWQRNGVPVGPASEIDYLALVPADQGHVFDCIVTATNSAGSAASTSNAHAAAPWS